jgi:hypothetical protein
MVTRKPGEELVFLVGLLEFRPPAPGAAAIADGGAAGYTLGGYMVAAMAIVLKAGTLATITPRVHRTHANLVDEAGSGAGRDKVASCSLVAFENVLGVTLEEAQASKDVGGRPFGGGCLRGLLERTKGYRSYVLEVGHLFGDGGRWMRGRRARLCGGHEDTPSWSGLRGAPTPPGPLLYSTRLSYY